jgi:phosphate/sulfate permease
MLYRGGGSGILGEADQGETKELKMRSLILAAVAMIGIGLLGIPDTLATPANGAIIGKAIAAESLAQDVDWWWRRWRRYWRYWY